MAMACDVIQKVIQIAVALEAGVEGGAIEASLQSTHFAQLGGQVNIKVTGFVAQDAAPEGGTVEALGQ